MHRVLLSMLLSRCTCLIHLIFKLGKKKKKHHACTLNQEGSFHLNPSFQRFLAQIIQIYPINLGPNLTYAPNVLNQGLATHLLATRWPAHCGPYSFKLCTNDSVSNYFTTCPNAWLCCVAKKVTHSAAYTYPTSERKKWIREENRFRFSVKLSQRCLCQRLLQVKVLFAVLRNGIKGVKRNENFKYNRTITNGNTVSMEERMIQWDCLRQSFVFILNWYHVGVRTQLWKCALYFMK